MTADYNGWNDAPEAEREAMDLYSHQDLEREALVQEKTPDICPPAPHYVRTMGDWDLRPAA